MSITSRVALFVTPFLGRCLLSSLQSSREPTKRLAIADRLFARRCFKRLREPRRFSVVPENLEIAQRVHDTPKCSRGIKLGLEAWLMPGRSLAFSSAGYYQ